MCNPIIIDVRKKVSKRFLICKTVPLKDLVNFRGFYCINHTQGYRRSKITFPNQQFSFIGK